MSRIDDQIRELREREKQLETEKKKIEFLNHILNSTKEYSHKDFSEVKDGVISLLTAFVEKSIEAIENSSKLIIEVESNRTTPSPSQENKQTFKQETTPQRESEKPADTPVQDKLSFALEHRHLAGKTVCIANDKNMSVTGEVVGLDSPNIIVKTKDGHVIRVPKENVSLV